MYQRIFEILDNSRYSAALNERLKERYKIKKDRLIFWKYIICFAIGMIIAKILF